MTAFSFCQETESSISFITNCINEIASLNINNAEKNIILLKKSELKNKLKIYIDIKQNNGYKLHNHQKYIENLNIQKRTIDVNYLLDILILTEDAILYKKDRIKAFHLAHKGYKVSESIKNSFFQTQFLLNILNVYISGIINTDKNVNFYLEKLFELNKKNIVYLFKYYSYKIYLNEIGLLKGSNKKKINQRRLISNKIIKKLDSLSRKLTPSQNNLLIELYHLKGLNSLSKKNI